MNQSVFYWSQPINNQCCGGTSLCGSYYDCKAPFSSNLRKTEKMQVYYSQELETAHLGSHSKISGREGEAKLMHRPGVLLLLGSRVEAWGFLASVFVNLKHRRAGI